MKSLLNSAVLAVLFTLAALFTLAMAPAALAVTDGTTLILATEAEGEEEGEPAPSTTMVSEGGIEPAELAPPPAEDEREDQWTAKFLAPLVAILGAIGVAAAFALYGLRLRGRYRVVE